jgi:hypothetical protein
VRTRGGDDGPSTAKLKTPSRNTESTKETSGSVNLAKDDTTKTTKVDTRRSKENDETVNPTQDDEDNECNIGSTSFAGSEIESSRAHSQDLLPRRVSPVLSLQLPICVVSAQSSLVPRSAVLFEGLVCTMLTYLTFLVCTSGEIDTGIFFGGDVLIQAMPPSLYVYPIISSPSMDKGWFFFG